MNKKMHKVVDILVKNGFNTWDAIRMVGDHFDEATRLYPDVTAASKIAKLVVLAS